MLTTNKQEVVENEPPKDTANGKGFTVLLNGQKDLEDQLEQFKKVCEAYDKHQRKRAKRRYYNLALMAKIDNNTKEDEMKRLLKNNTRTFLIDMVTLKMNQIEALVYQIRQATAQYQLEEPKNQITIGLTLQITGDACRMGRTHNNCSLLLARGDSMTLTTNMAYRYCCFKEISYILNLKYYLPYIQLYDEILVGHEVRGVVIKKLRTALCIRISEGGILNSYDYLELPNQCYCLEPPTLEEIFVRDLNLVKKLNIDFIAVPHISCIRFLKILQKECKASNSLKIIGNLDLEYIRSKMLDLMGIIKYIDFLWITNLFSNTEAINIYLMQDVIPIAKSLKKPIIGSVPLKHCSDFKLFENHEFLWKIDCMFIEKSGYCDKYPLIVKKLLPIRNYRLAVVENANVIHDILSNSQTIVNFIIRTVSSIECRAIFLNAKCDTAAKALSRVEIYCPVYVILPLEYLAEENNEEESKCLVDLSKNLNLRRNLRTIMYTKEMNDCEYKPIDYGLEYVRNNGGLETGDFIISIEVGKEEGDENVQLGAGEDVVIMRAYFVPPFKVGDKYKCN